MEGVIIGLKQKVWKAETERVGHGRSEGWKAGRRWDFGFWILDDNDYDDDRNRNRKLGGWYDGRLRG